MKLLFSVCLLIVCISASAQVKDTVKKNKRNYESIFANDDTLTKSDYLQSFEKMFQALNKASVVAQPVSEITSINLNIDDDDSALSIIKDRFNNNERALNIRNLQMFNILLGQIHKDTKEYAISLNKYDSVLDGVKKQIFDLRKDTVIHHIFRDSSLKALFKPQIQQLRTKWRYADSLIKKVNILIDNTLARTSDNLISTDELQLQGQRLMDSTGSRAFTKERNYLWQSRKTTFHKSFSQQFGKTITSEKEITKYYFSHTHNQFFLILLCGLIFFLWVFYNFKSLKKLNRLDSTELFHFKYVKAIPIFASLVFMLNLAPLFDLNAPFVYIEFVEFLMMVVLTLSFWKRLPHKLFFFWIIFIFLFLFQSFSRRLGLSFYLNRWLSLIINSASLLLGVFALVAFKRRYKTYKILFFAAILYVLFNFLSVVCNLFGRVTLMQIFSATGTYAFVQAVALFVFIYSITEAFLLQIQSSRIRKNYPENFDYPEIRKGILRLIVLWAVIIWLVVFTTNLNLYYAISFIIKIFLSSPRIIGSFTFTFGGIALFLIIMWAANFLQKYIAFFFGDVNDDAAFDNKSQRSRLMITRLILLVAGFLLAVAASGLAIDRITVILGALSVGIGLGLQNIVNNFVSGIILIFDRTMRIGDTVEVGDKKGRVKEISMRSSTLLTPDGAEVIIPNGDILSHNFVNWSLSNNYRRVDLTFSVDQPTLTDENQTEIMNFIKSSPDVLASKEPEVFIDAITAASTQLKVYFWCKDVNKAEQVQSEVYKSVYKYLQEKGIKIL
ncbi:MAG TPA: mechanosensitive ion channel domain-containing protein [Hanamia sp.]|nr:mechanosensitive ion channel domain-containing protein [Hanamia sp.]